MPLNLMEMYKGTIVDRVSEWGADGKERPLNPIMRGIVVKVDGDPMGESVKAIWVCFGPPEKREVQALVDKKLESKEVTVSDTTVLAFNIKARELNCVFDHESRISKEAWIRLFRIPTNVGFEFENRKAKGSKKRKISDPLVLVPRMEDGPVKDERDLGNIEQMGLPEKEA